MEEIFSRIEISSKLDIQGTEDKKEDTESIHFSFYSALSQIARDKRHIKLYKKCKSSNPRIKIENHQDKILSLEEKTSKKKLAPITVFFYG